MATDDEKLPLLGPGTGEDGPVFERDTEVKSITRLVREMLLVSIPYTINGLSINASSFLNAFILSQLNNNTLAATSLTTSVQLLTIASTKAALASTSVVVARLSDKEEGLGIVLQVSCFQSLLQSLPIILIFLVSEKMFLLFGQDPDIAKIAGEYLRSFTIAVPAILLLKSCELFAVATKHPNIVLITNILNATLTFGLSYILVLGELGAPELGIRGAAYATAISTWAMLLGMLLFIRFSTYFKDYNVFSYKNNLDIGRLKVLKSLFSIGLPIGAQVAIEFFYNFLKSIFAGLIGDDSLSAEQIVSQYSGLVLSPALAIATVNGVMVGRDVANCSGKNVKKIGNIGILLSLIVPLICLILFVSIPKQLASVFLDVNNSEKENILKIVKYLFLVNAIDNLFDSLKNASAGNLRGFYDTTVPTIIMLSVLWFIGLPSSYLFMFPVGLGLTGFFMGKGVNLIVSSLFMLNRWRYSSKDPNKAISDAKVSLKDKIVTLFRVIPCLNNQSDEGMQQSPSLI